MTTHTVDLGIAAAAAAEAGKVLVTRKPEIQVVALAILVVEATDPVNDLVSATEFWLLVERLRGHGKPVNASDGLLKE